MKVAKVRYLGTDRSHHRRGPSGEEYRMYNPESEPPRWNPVESIRDAEKFAENDVLEVRWTPMGEVVRAAEGPLSGVEQMLQNWGYTKKRKVASRLEVGISGNPKESELDEALEEEIQNLTEVMENQ